MPVSLVKTLCIASSVPRSHVSDRSSPLGSCFTFWMSAPTTLAVSFPLMRTRSRYREYLSTSVAMCVFLAPAIRSPSQWRCRSSSLDLGRPIPNRDGVDDLPAPLPLGAATLSASHCPSAPQTCDEFPLEHSARLQIKATVDRLVRNLHRGAALRRSEPTGDLL